MSATLCRILRPLCTACTLLMMSVLTAYFWGTGWFSGDTVLRLLVSYFILLGGSLIMFYINAPEALGRGRIERP